MIDDKELEPEIVAYAVPPFVDGERKRPLLRIKRVGLTFFVENKHVRRDVADDGTETTEDVWKVVAIAKGNKARGEAFQWLHEANAQAIQMSQAGVKKGAMFLK